MTHVYEKLLAVEFDKLPEQVQKAYLAPPLFSVPVKQDGDTFHLSKPSELDHPADQALIPKLGIKSWRDSGVLGVIYEGVNIRSILEPLLSAPTEAQELMAHAWIESNTPLRVHLMPYVDFSEVSEVRFLANRNSCQRISICLRGQSAKNLEAALPKITAFAVDIIQHLPDRSHILELAYLSTGEIRLVEVNPGLTPQDIAELQRLN
jgi:hypothetical protein